MKAIYINLDPYLAAFAAWLKGGKVGPAPSFDPLPLAVTIPLGETAALYLPADCAALETEIEPQIITVEGETISIVPYGYDYGLPEGTIAFNQIPALSALAPALKYAVIPATGDSASVGVKFYLGESGEPDITIQFTVLVRRETASGPVDLVDFTPPAAAPSAADIRSALVAAGNGALEGVDLGGARLVVPQPNTPEGSMSTVIGGFDEEGFDTLGPLVAGDDVQAAVGIGSNS